MIVPKVNLSTGWKWGLGAAFLLLALSSLVNRGERLPQTAPAFPDPLAAWEEADGTETADSAGSTDLAESDGSYAEVRSATAVEDASAFDPVIARIRENMRNPKTDPVAAETGPEPSRGPGITGAVVRLSGSLLLVAAAIVALVVISRRLAFGRDNPTSAHLKVVSRAWLSSKSSLYLVRVPGKTLVVGEGPNGVNLVSEIPDEVMAREMAVQGADTADAPRRAAFQGDLQNAQTEVRSSDLALKVRDSIAYFRDMTSRARDRR